MSAHARLSPSASHQWSHCTASIQAVEAARASGRIPPDESSPAADEGTAHHTVRESCLDWGEDPHDWIGETIVVNGVGYRITEESAENLQPGIDWIRERASNGMLVETKVALDPWLPGQFGTIDCAFVFRSTSAVYLVLSDLKYGFIGVDPVRNPQQMLYGLGACRRLFGPDTAKWPDRLLVMIDQPRKGGLKEWECSKAELLEFGEWIAERGAEALSGNGVFRPSEETCRYCPLAFPGGCAARDAWKLSMFDLDLEDLDDLDTPPALAPVTALSRDRLAYLWRHAKALKSWVDSISAQAFAAAQEGDPLPGTKLVLGDLGDRTWADPAEAEATLKPLGDAAYAPRKLISYPQAEGMLKPRRSNPGRPDVWEKISGKFTRAPARPVLVDINDKRPEYRPADTLADAIGQLEDLD